MAVICFFAHWKIFPYPPYGVTLTYFIYIFGRATPTATPNCRNFNSQTGRLGRDETSVQRGRSVKLARLHLICYAKWVVRAKLA